MYEEAASLSHSVLKRLCEINSNSNNPYYETVESGDELEDMLESAGMVYVQSLNQLGRYLQSQTPPSDFTEGCVLVIFFCQ